MHKNLTFILGLVFILLVLYCILNYEHFGGDIAAKKQAADMENQKMVAEARAGTDKLMMDKAMMDKAMMDKAMMDKNIYEAKVAADSKAGMDKAMMDDKAKVNAEISDNINAESINQLKEARKVYLTEVINNEIERDPEGFSKFIAQLLDLLEITTNTTSNFISSVIDLSEKSANINDNIIKSIPVTQKNKNMLAASKNAVMDLKKTANRMKGNITTINSALSNVIKQAKK